MRILITGSREWTDEQKIFNNLVAGHRYLDQVGVSFTIPTLVHGEARGADKLAANSAEQLGWLVEGIPFDSWRHFSDPRNRNTEMVSLGADLCIAFYIKPNGRKGGTRDCYEKAIDAGITTWVVQ